jgi:hypothetical protein
MLFSIASQIATHCIADEKARLESLSKACDGDQQAEDDRRQDRELTVAIRNGHFRRVGAIPEYQLVIHRPRHDTAEPLRIEAERAAA